MRHLGRMIAVSSVLCGAATVSSFAAASVSLAGASTTGTCLSLGNPGAYSEYSTSTALVSDDTTDAGVAYGGQATLTGDSFATASTPSTQITLIAGAALSATSVTLNNGSAEYVGPLTGSITDAGGGTNTQVPASGLPFQFSSAGTNLSAVSATLGGFSTNGTIVKTASTITLTGTGTGTATNVFDATAPGSGVSSVVINAPVGAVVLVNIAAASLDLNKLTVTLQGGVTANDVLFNLPTSVSVTLTKDTIEGTILAPGASVTTNHLVLNGGGILVNVANFTNDNITGPLFTGCVPSGGPGTSVPESPSILFLPLAGVGVLGAGLVWRQRRRRAGSAIAA